MYVSARWSLLYPQVLPPLLPVAELALLRPGLEVPGERAASEQPQSSERINLCLGEHSLPRPPSFLVAPAIDAAAGLRACPTMPWRLSSIFHSSSSCDIKSKWREGHWSLLSCPGIRSKLYSCLNLLPCTLQGSVVSSLLSALCVAKRQTSPSDKCTQTLRLR